MKGTMVVYCPKNECFWNNGTFCLKNHINIDVEQKCVSYFEKERKDDQN